MILLNEDSIFGKPSSPGLFVTVTLKHTDNRVWRSLLVPSNAHLGWFHAVLQIAMGWTNSHLHQFTFKDKTFADPRFDLYDPLTIDERKCSLDKLLTNSKDPLHYQYDFADSWEHAIFLTKTGTTHYPMAATCLEGGGACPPEDCGGIPGYLSLLKALKKPNSKTAKESFDQLGYRYDPDAFSLENVNTALQELPWPTVSESALRKIIRSQRKRKN